MRLKLTRPLAFFDIEATGLDKQNDKIIELAICKIHPDYSREVKTWLINPGMPIPAESSAIHGIFDADVIDCPTFEQAAEEIWTFILLCDFGGFNSNSYDIPMLFFEFLKTGRFWNYHAFSMVDAGNIFKRKEERTLTAAYKFYCGTVLENAHSAEADILATVEVFINQMDRYPDLPSDIQELSSFCNYGRTILDLSGKFTTDNEGDIIFNFGGNKGKKAKYDLGYVSWMYGKDFASDTMKICEQLLGINQ
ncbi:3'-5' exonuclease [Pedobacter gandavensis]|uniref:3'-5' exonuclease n=1 Tax=Pedobacter gandavensis TaxID=2679963 RepID=A0ABR6EU87_9SPHI|nr:3'-5' exonuclease [Pedobacter gandavensis]MBB2148833.1 3'-5' exonuclease [Pedobacter gandavensis]